jgi:hypothetical protein
LVLIVGSSINLTPFIGDELLIEVECFNNGEACGGSIGGLIVGGGGLIPPPGVNNPLGRPC